MTDRRALQLLLLEKKCVESRPRCDKECNSCPCYVDPYEIAGALSAATENLKARNPGLYLVSEIELLRDILKKEKKNGTDI